MTTRTGTCPLRPPLSPNAAVEKRARRDGTRVNRFVVAAEAEKPSAMATADQFVERSARAARDAFDGIMDRAGGEPPRSDDVLRTTLGRQPSQGVSAHPCPVWNETPFSCRNIA